jgi:serine/threonine protein kinase
VAGWLVAVISVCSLGLVVFVAGGWARKLCGSLKTCLGEICSACISGPRLSGNHENLLLPQSHTKAAGKERAAAKKAAEKQRAAAAKAEREAEAARRAAVAAAAKRAAAEEAVRRKAVAAAVAEGEKERLLKEKTTKKLVTKLAKVFSLDEAEAAIRVVGLDEMQARNHITEARQEQERYKAEVQQRREEAAAADDTDEQAALVSTRKALAKGGFTFTEIAFAEMRNEKHIAKGGFGDVSRVMCRSTIMARKKINAVTQVDSKKALRFLKNEVRTMAAVTHNNIVLLIGICIQPGELSILMEYAEMGTLREQVEKNPRMRPWKHFGLLLGVVNGVRRLHAHTPKAIIHGDLKTLNILVMIDAATGEWIAKITDFGLATGSGFSSSAGSKASGLTVSHSPPEVLSGDEATVASDIYSLGIVFWEVVTGQVPFEGMALPAVLAGVLTRAMRPSLSTAPPAGSVFNAKQWALFAEQLLPGGQGGSGAPGGCWAQDAAARPAAADIFRTFQRAAQHFEAPAGAGHTLQLQHLNHYMGRIQQQQEAMLHDIRELQQLATRMNGALNAVIAGESVDCFRLFWIVPAPPSGDGLISRIKDWAAALSPASWLAKDVLLVPLDEYDLRPIPCGPDPTENPGYPLTLPKQFFKDHAAAIKLSYKLLKYALKAGKLANLPLPQLPDGPAGAMGELLDSVCATATEQLPAAVNAALDAAADSLATSKAAGGGADAGKAKATKATGAAYLKLKALVDAKHPTWRQSLGGGPHMSADGRVGWVRAENVAAWEASRI